MARYLKGAGSVIQRTSSNWICYYSQIWYSAIPDTRPTKTSTELEVGLPLMKGSVKYKHSESHHQDLTADTTGLKHSESYHQDLTADTTGLKHSESYHQDLTAYTTGLKHSESHHQDLTAYTTGLKHSESHHQDLTADTTGLKRVGVLCQGLQYGQKQRVCGQVLKEQRYPCRKGRICNTRCSLTRRGHRLSCITMHHFCSSRGNSNVKVQGSVCNTTGMQCVCVCVCVCVSACARAWQTWTRSVSSSVVNWESLLKWKMPVTVTFSSNSTTLSPKQRYI